MKKLASLLFILFFFTVPCNLSTANLVHATYDPLSVPNNKFGIHIITASADELSPAAELTNSSGGDWGYLTVLIESKDRDHSKWQQFFDQLRRKHLIPILRLATSPEGDYWKRPYDGEEQAWADFLDNLVWPSQNRYIIIYNEPNQAHEWGNSVDAANYAQTLDKTITVLKKKSSDFFILNAGFDASAPNKPPNYLDETSFLQQMQDAVPGIFDKLDGWDSHSYPNPNFAGSPEADGRGTIRTWQWEKDQSISLGVKKNLPVFITETGWKHAEGVSLDKSLPDAETVAGYYKQAFGNAWSSSQIVAITPFLLSYQEAPFDHFSFKKYTGEPQKDKILGVSTVSADNPDYYPQYTTIQNLAKTAGQPLQAQRALLVKGAVYTTLVADQTYLINLTVKNVGESIWGDQTTVSLKPILGGKELQLQEVKLPPDQKIEPGSDYTFNIQLTAPKSGSYHVELNLFSDNKQFETPPFTFDTTVKQPVILKIRANLQWKNKAGGNYLLEVAGAIGNTIKQVMLGDNGQSNEVEAKYLLPDYAFDFTLEKPYYQAKTIHQTVHSGENTLDFGTLQPDIPSAILNPAELWSLLPLSN